MPWAPMPDAPSLPTLLITRPAERAQRFADECKAAVGQSVPVLIAPVVEIELLSAPNLTNYSAVIFTSEAGVAAAAHQAGPGVAWAVGPRTAAAAQAAGYEVRTAGGTVIDLMAQLRQARPKGAMIHLRGVESRGSLASSLRDAGLNVDEAVVYRQKDCEMSPAGRAALAGHAPLVLPVFSVASARRLLAHEITAPHALVAISDIVAAVWPPKKQATVQVARAATAEAMAEAVAATYIGSVTRAPKGPPRGGDV